MSYNLVELNASHEKAFLKMVADYQAHDPQVCERLYPGTWSALTFRNFLKACEKARRDWRPKAGQVSETRYVLIDGAGEICGNGVMRFPLDEGIEALGGNLVFDVPPSKRREGFGALVLNRMLFEAVRAGMARVLLTTEPDNAAAIKSIEKNRGTFESDSKGRKRFWISFR
jgi:predicted acetyltransferase